MNEIVPHRPQAHNTLNVYRTLPPNCIPFVVDDDYALPFILRGECVVVDTTDTTPRVGDIYVIEWTGGSRNLCQARISKHPHNDGQPAWMVGSMRTHTPEQLQRFLDAASSGKGGIPEWTLSWADGPFTFDHLQEKLLGAVIGLYEPKVDDMIRKAGRPVDIGGN